MIGPGCGAFRAVVAARLVRGREPNCRRKSQLACSQRYPFGSHNRHTLLGAIDWVSYAASRREGKGREKRKSWFSSQIYGARKMTRLMCRDSMQFCFPMQQGLVHPVRPPVWNSRSAPSRLNFWSGVLCFRRRRCIRFIINQTNCDLLGSSDSAL